jgi:cation-transporting ATPase 13A3/4/5
MDEDAPLTPEPGQDHGRRGHRAPNGNGRASLYRMSSNQSRSSIFEDVEMAHEEVMNNQ